MIFVHFTIQNRQCYGIVEDDRIREIEGDFLSEYELTNIYHNMADIQFLPPVSPSKIVAIGLNYKHHAKEMALPLPSEPLLFLKPPSAVIAHQQTIHHPAMSAQIDYEGELALVIGRQACRVAVEDAGHYIAGATICNDVTARDIQTKDGQWTRAKGFDTFAPLGPWVANELDYDNLAITTRLNGKTVQSSNTNDMIYGTAEIVSYVSHVMTLFPGDVIITGTPSGIGPMEDGDIVEIAIEGIGVLRNQYVKNIV